MNYKTLLIAAATATLLMSGCDADRSTTLQDSLEGNTVEDKIAGHAVFNPTTGEIPYPNNILFAPNSSTTSAADGMTLNIPYEPTDADAAIKQQLNQLTGFSTTAAITAPITATLKLDPATGFLLTGVNVHKVTIDALSGAVSSVDENLTFGVDYIATQSGSNIAILPLKPLLGNTNYMVVLTDDLKDAAGRVLTPDIVTALTLSPNEIQKGGALDDATVDALNQIRLGNMAMMVALGVTPGDNNIVQIWNFHTQVIGAVQANIASNVIGTSSLTLNNKGFTTKYALGLTTNPTSGKAQIYDGNLSGLPQYMPQSITQNPTNALGGQFQYSAPFTPEVNATITVPVIAFIPNDNSGCGAIPVNGWPVVIYQHGITRARTDLFVYGETLAGTPICHAAIALDMPLHGVVDDTNPFYKIGIERTFDFDFVTEDADGNVIAKAPDGVIDSSGVFYMNLEHITTTRDNMHQTTSDLLELEASILNADLDGNTSLVFDATSVSFLAHSLGAISSVGYVNQTTGLTTATLAMPGQGVIDIIRYSPVFSGAINAGLAAVGINEGTSTYESFMLASQTIVEDADPANYAAAISVSTLPILEIEAVGNGSEGSGDQHILNSIASAPLAGTEPFIKSTQAVDINTTGLSDGDFYIPTGTKTVSRLTEGEHRSPLDPQYSAIATDEIHTEIATFILFQGSKIKVAHTSIIQQP